MALKLLIVINCIDKGGAEKLIEVTAPLFKKKGIDVSILLLNNKLSIPEYIKTLEDHKIPIYDLGYSNLYNPFLSFAIRKFLKKNQFDIVHTHLFPSLYWVSLAKKCSPFLKKNNTKFIYTEHSNNNSRRKYAPLKFVEKFIYQSFDKIIGITAEVKINLQNWIGDPNHKVIEIPNGVSLEHLQKAPVMSSNELKKTLGLGDEQNVLILMVASFRYPKNQKVLIDSLKHLDEKFHVVFAGTGDTIEENKAHAQQSGLAHRVHFLGFRNDALSWMKSVDINVLSSEYEGMSGVTLESLASGKPFLGSNVRGINDIVPDDRFLFEEGNAADLANKVMHIAEPTAYADEMVNDALAFVQKFDIENMINSHIALYNSVLSSK